MASILERKKNIKKTSEKKTRAEYAEDALYREVWEEVNNDKTMAFIKKYGRVLIATALILLIVVTGAQIGIRNHNANKMAMATSYDVALENVDASALASISENSSGVNSDLALFQSYLIDHDTNKIEKLAENAKTQDFRDLARLHVVSVRGDKMTANEFENYLKPMTTKSSPFYYTAMLMIAQKYIASDERESADKWLEKIVNDSECPDTILTTAQMLR